MPSRPLPNLLLESFFDLGEDNWKDANDLNMLKLSVLAQAGVSEKLAVEPGAPAAGLVILLDETNATHPNAVAVFDDGAWVYFSPNEGWLVYNRSANYYEFFDGAVWAELETGGGGGGSGGGVSTVAVVAGTAYDLLAADASKYLVFTAATAKTVTVRPNATEALPADGEWHIRNRGASNLTLVAGVGVTLNVPTGGNLIVPTGGTVTLKRTAADVFDVMGVTQSATVLGDAAFKNTGTAAGTVAAGDDARIVSSLQPSDIGTSGTKIPRLDAINTWSAQQTFQVALRVSAPLTATAVVIDSAAGQQGYYDLRNANSLRWRLAKDASTESGGNAGSNFTITRYDDSGTSLGLAFRFIRSTGIMSVAGGITPVSDNAADLGSASFRWREIFCANNVINTSDETLKRDIQPITDELLDAWAGVQWVAYRWKDAYEEKGPGARWHFGMIAQHVRDVIDAHFGEGTAVRMGIICYDEWEAQSEIVSPIMAEHTIKVQKYDEDGVLLVGEFSEQLETYDTGEVEITQPAREAGSRWGLRYGECQAIENAYQRREIARLRALVQ